MVQGEGVSGWVRKTAGRRVNPASDPAHHQWYIDQMSQTALRVVLETLAYLSTQNLTNVLPQVRIPTLILASKENAAGGHTDHTQAMAQLLPNARLLVILGTSGYVQHSAPEKCVSAWREFVGALRHHQLLAGRG